MRIRLFRTMLSGGSRATPDRAQVRSSDQDMCSRQPIALVVSIHLTLQVVLASVEKFNSLPYSVAPRPSPPFFTLTALTKGTSATPPYLENCNLPSTTGLATNRPSSTAKLYTSTMLRLAGTTRRSYKKQ